jgi:hypothetical protein
MTDVCKDHNTLNVKFQQEKHEAKPKRKLSKEFNPEYPFLSEVKAIMYAAGDYKEPDDDSSKTMHTILFQLYINYQNKCADSRNSQQQHAAA